MNKYKAGGREYTSVASRIKAFYELYERGSIKTAIEEINAECIIMKASVFTDKTSEEPDGTGHSLRYFGEANVVRDCPVETAETLAIGRALGAAGIGLTESFASKEEMDQLWINKPEEKPLVKLKQKKEPAAQLLKTAKKNLKKEGEK